MGCFMSQTHRTKVLIIGAGPAGYTAAIYAARANLQPIVVQGLQPGGQLTITTDVENYPGFADIIQGPWLMEQMAAQAEKVGAKLIFDLITDVDFGHPPFRCRADSGDEYLADSVIIATGAQAKWLGIPSEKHFQGFGVSGCATCDGFFFKGKEVVVVGGGNSAMEEALYLTHHASKVTVIHRRNEFRGEWVLRDRVKSHPKINVIWDSEVAEIVGTEQPARAVTGLKVKNVKTGATTDLPCEGVFIAIGHSPATAVFKDKLGMDEHGYILTKPDSTETSIPGVYAAGDVKDKVFRQAVTAAGMGCMAALEAERFLTARGLETHTAELAKTA